MNATLEPEIGKVNRPVRDIVGAACQRIPPLWPLRNFVAVNPFLGLTGWHFAEAALLIQKAGHGEMLMPAQFYLEQIASGRIQESDFQAAIALAEKTLPAEWAQEIGFSSLEALRRELQLSSQPQARILTFADFLEGQQQTGWLAFVVEEISKWCSAYYDQGQSSWRMPWRSLGLLAAWNQAARLDMNPELLGLKKFRSFVAALPEDPWELIDQTLDKLGVAEEQQLDFLHRQLMSIPGWSSYVQYLVREKSMSGHRDSSLVQLLAIRLAYDLALFQQFAKKAGLLSQWEEHLAAIATPDVEPSPGLLARLVAQLALETGFQTDWFRKLRKGPPTPSNQREKTLQAVFCIDVRSEAFRRALEAQAAQIETIGFAGFFGMALEYVRFGQAGGDAHCPVLLSPKFKVREQSMRDARPGAERRSLRRRDFQRTLNGAWNAFKTSAISCFSFVETAGLGFAVKLAKDSLGLSPTETTFTTSRQRKLGPQREQRNCRCEQPGHSLEAGISVPEKIALAAGALKNMGLLSDFGKVVLFCGHGSATTNNPYGSALDCGACGGHAGDANARVAAAILNEPAVRDGLKQQGIAIPSETVFISGLHNTTTDEIVIYAEGELSAAQQAELEKCKVWLSAASKQARRERAGSLGLAKVPDTEIDQKICARSRDWSQVRPEWGLAGNAAFIASPRERTRELNLAGRTFLHNYHAQLDPNKSTLELILTAPVVVASWINLQYYGSAVDNRLFGSGNKVLHNVVGTFGIWQGNGGDLQPGLPLQSIHDGTQLRHEPLRLSIFVEASREVIDTVLRSHPEVCQLVDHCWIHLFAIEPGEERIWRRLPRFTWEDTLALG